MHTHDKTVAPLLRFRPRHNNAHPHRINKSALLAAMGGSALVTITPCVYQDMRTAPPSVTASREGNSSARPPSRAERDGTGWIESAVVSFTVPNDFVDRKCPLAATLKSFADLAPRQTGGNAILANG